MSRNKAARSAALLRARNTDDLIVPCAIVYDLGFVRNVVRLFSRRPNALAVARYENPGYDPHIEVAGRLRSARGHEPVPMHRRDRPPLGWRDTRSGKLYRTSLAELIELAADARRTTICA